MKRVDAISKVLWLTSFIFCSVLSLCMDVLGQDGCRQMVDDRWVSGWYTVPIAVIVIAGAVSRYLQVRFRCIAADRSDERVEGLAEQSRQNAARPTSKFEEDEGDYDA